MKPKMPIVRQAALERLRELTGVPRIEFYQVGHTVETFSWGSDILTPMQGVLRDYVESTIWLRWVYDGYWEMMHESH